MPIKIVAVTLIFYSPRQSNTACRSVVLLDLQLCRQVKPKSNTRVFGLGFSFAKIQGLSAFSVVGAPSFRSFRGSYGCVRISLSVAVADGFMPRKVRGRQKGVCQAILPKANEKPLGAIGWRFICLPTRS